MHFIGNHGTDEKCVSSILKNGFIPSKGKKQWYGRGVYFFIDGINSSSIDKLAEQWAKDQAYNKETKKTNYSQYAIIEAKIISEKDTTIDLREDDAQKAINHVRDTIKNICNSKNIRMCDDEIWLFMENKFGIKAIITNTYIKFGYERIKRIDSRINNCTIISVLDQNIIDKNSIKLIRKGDI